MAKPEFNERVERHSICVLVDNHSGVLSQVTRMFSRKGYNIESLAVGATYYPEVSRITIEVVTNEHMAVCICNQLRKLMAVHSVKHLLSNEFIRCELVLIKANASTSEACNRIIQIAEIFRASIIDVTPKTMTIAMYGDDSKSKALEDLLKEVGILELVRTGMVALERGTDTIYDNTKLKGEFNYGKNVL